MAETQQPNRQLTPQQSAGMAIKQRLETPNMVQKIERLLPAKLQGSAQRLISRALLYFARRPDLIDCTADSFVLCVISAAELGLAIDGRLAHAVPFKNNKTGKMEAAFIPDYKGVVAVAKRTGIVKDVRAEIVCENDQFDFCRGIDADRLEHHIDICKPRGATIGAYAIVDLPDGTHHVEGMTMEQLERVQRKAKSQHGPWASDPDEMRRKTVVKRALKYFCEDPDIVRALETDDELLPALPAEPPSGKTIHRRLSQSNGHPVSQDVLDNADYTTESTEPTAGNVASRGDQLVGQMIELGLEPKEFLSGWELAEIAEAKPEQLDEIGVELESIRSERAKPQPEQPKPTNGTRRRAAEIG